MLVELLDGSEGWPLAEALNREVYPPEVMATAIWRDIVWAEADKRVIVRAEGKAVCHAGLYFRDGLLNAAPARLCGIGGVMTSPAAQRRGHASAAMRRAAAAMAGVDFGLLFCEPHNVRFYGGLGWRVFEGTVHCAQPACRIKFDMMPTMVLPLRTMPGGEIDLCGLPW
jgi:aminoglycoside 2'-N-acetyltransferase I